VAKVKKNFLCSNCGAQSPKWIGNCPSCNEWNTYLEETITVGNKREEQRKAMRSEPNYGSSKIIPLQDIVGSKLPRIKIHDGELNRV
jgi:DNA repair protein RadA/Sms